MSLGAFAALSAVLYHMNFSVDSLDQVGGARQWDVVGSKPFQAKGKRKRAERNDYDGKYHRYKMRFETISQVLVLT